MRRVCRLLCAVALLVPVPGCSADSGSRPELFVFAAASLGDLMPEVAAAFEAEHDIEVVLNLAASNALAQQILAGGAADLFVSADPLWVDLLEKEGLTVGEPRDLFANDLVVIGHRDSRWQIDSAAGLADADPAVLSIADPNAVPAGRYARRALEAIDADGESLWQRLADRIAPALDVRAALALVAAEPAVVGIVYRTDALDDDRVRILCPLPLPDGVQVAYRATMLGDGDRTGAGRFFDFLGGTAARAIAARHGFRSFTVVEEPG